MPRNRSANLTRSHLRLFSTSLISMVLTIAGMPGFMAKSPYDPLKALKNSPNIVIVIDNSSEMAKDVNGTVVGVDQFGTPSNWVFATDPTGCSANKRKWKTWLTPKLPSRIATVKSLLMEPTVSDPNSDPYSHLSKTRIEVEMPPLYEVG